MKVNLLSLLSVVLVLSVKAYEISAREEIQERRSEVYHPALAFLDIEEYHYSESETLDSLINVLGRSNTIKERYVGFSGSTPSEYIMFEKLKESASQHELNNLMKHYSPVVRVYAYRALIANEMEVNANYENFLYEDTTSVNWFSGCIYKLSTVQQIVEQGFVE
ncbi:MAG: hypothetical protein HRT58_12495 [Crocinitomicaceae bacterium]|nr:hypothetical protein [Flavobacteriales bacterium]NQZ36482.1 hypothetical protein [Crocinitomicaceae bacterium]